MSTMDLYAPPAITPPETQLPRWRAFRAMLDNPMAAWPRAIYERPIYSPPRRDFPLVYVCDPDAIRAVLVDRAENFGRAPLWFRLLKPMLGDGVLTSEGAQWRWQRETLAPLFQPRQLSCLAPTMAEAATRALERWRAYGSGPRDVAADMIEVTLEVILDTMLGGRAEHDIDAISREFAHYTAGLGKPGLADLAGAPTWLRRLTAPRAMAAVDYMRAGAETMIARRRANAPRGDLVDALFAARHPVNGRAMSDAEVRDNLLTFMAGGHETTALALAWSLYLIANHPQTQARIRAEAEAAAARGPLGAEGLADLAFTKQVVQEALRLYPPFPALSRRCLRETTLVGRRIEPGEIAVIPIYALHRHALYWKAPSAFDPDRFAPGAEPPPRYVYIPFGGGPRVCLGASFALMEATIVLASLVRGAHFAPVPTRDVRPTLRITMRPEGGLFANIRVIR